MRTRIDSSVVGAAPIHSTSGVRPSRQACTSSGAIKGFSTWTWTSIRLRWSSPSSPPPAS